MKKQTPSQTVGPYLRIGLIYGETQGDLVQDETIGERIVISGTVFDGNGEPIPDALVEIWQPDAQGIFNHPADPRCHQADPYFRGFGRAETRLAGKFQFRTVKPGTLQEGYAPFINVTVFARGMLVHAITRIYFADEPANNDDPVLLSIPPERRHTLLAQREEATVGVTYHFDIHLQGNDETVFFNPSGDRRSENGD